MAQNKRNILSQEKNKFYPEFAVFCADCQHEVLPIQSGFRLSLIYNLAIANRVKQPALSQQEKIIDQINTHIQAWGYGTIEEPSLCGQKSATRDRFQE